MKLVDKRNYDPKYCADAVASALNAKMPETRVQVEDAYYGSDPGTIVCDVKVVFGSQSSFVASFVYRNSDYSLDVHFTARISNYGVNAANEAQLFSDYVQRIMDENWTPYLAMPEDYSRF